MTNIAPTQKPVLIPLSVAAQIAPLGESQLAKLCKKGEFKTAVQPGGNRGQWFVDRNEVVARVTPRNAK